MLRRFFLQTAVLGLSAGMLCVLAAAQTSAVRRPPTDQAIALKAVARLLDAGRIDGSEAAADRSAVGRAVRLIDLLPQRRAAPVASALAQVAAVAARMTAPRALALFGQLTVNDDWFARHGPPPAQSDTTDADGVVYRYFPGAAFEFHPLANFTALNEDATSKNVPATQTLAAALVARGVPEPNGGVGWEYYFDFAGGRAPWLSGFAQAIGAEAFARAANLLGGEAGPLEAEADAAYRTIHDGLLEYPRFGLWIRLYGFNDNVVLNAQLQTAISLERYANASGNSSAAALATSLRDAAARALPQFDTGSWTLYSLSPAAPSPPAYQAYVVSLLQTLAATDPRFAAAATRFAAYQSQPPRFRLADGGVGAVEFWVSKPATVRVSALGSMQQLSVSGGWHRVAWVPGHAGIFPVALRATDWAGNTASAEALPIVRVTAPARPRRARARVVHGALTRAGGGNGPAATTTTVTTTPTSTTTPASTTTTPGAPATTTVTVTVPATTTPTSTTTTPTATTPTTTTPTTTTPQATTPPATTTTAPAAAPTSAASLAGNLAFPAQLSMAGGPRVSVSCTRACLFLVTLQRSYDGAPVLATRGALAAGASTRAQLPKVAIASGRYRFSVWLVAQVDPASVQVYRSPELEAS